MQSVRVYEINHNNTFKDVQYDMNDSLKSLVTKYYPALELHRIKIASGESVFNDLNTKIQTALYYGKAISIYSYMVNLTIRYESKCLNEKGLFYLTVDSRKKLSDFQKLVEYEIQKLKYKNLSDEINQLIIFSMKIDGKDCELKYQESLKSMCIKDGSMIDVKFDIDETCSILVIIDDMINNRKMYLKGKKNTTIYSVMSTIQRKVGIPIGAQRLCYDECLISGSEKFGDLNIENFSTFSLYKELVGGGCSFADLEGNPKKFSWNLNAPKWRVAKKGLCLEGKCTNCKCEAKNQMVVINMGLPVIYQLGMIGQQSTNCPMCFKYVKPVTCGLNNCEWRFIGVKETKNGLERVKCDWKNVKNEYHRFDDGKKSLVNWTSLVIETRVEDDQLTNDNICAICLEEIKSDKDEEKNKNILLNCRHKFHKSCLSVWSKIKTECPLCKTSWNEA